MIMEKEKEVEIEGGEGVREGERKIRRGQIERSRPRRRGR
jgi:hypothetical protein